MKNFKRILLTLVAALLVFAMCFAMVGCGDKDKDDKEDKASVSDKADKNEKESSENVEVKKDGPEEIADKVLTAMYKDCDAQALIDLVNDDVMAAAEKANGQTEDELVDQMQASFDSMQQLYDTMGDSVSITWKVGAVNDAVNSDEIKDEYKENAEVDVEEAKVVDVTLTVSATVSDQTESQDQQLQIPVILIDGEWSLDLANMGI